AQRHHRRRRRGADRHGGRPRRGHRGPGALQLLQQPGRGHARHHRALRLPPRAAARRDGRPRRAGRDRMILRRRERKRARIEIIPMIDVVFFLLVFFMMASLSMTVYRGLPVNLPRATSGTTPPAETAAITVTRDGQAYLDRQPVTRTMLAERLRGLVGANPMVAIVITADEAAMHGRVVDVLDEVRTAGVTRMAIAIRPEAPRP